VLALAHFSHVTTFRSLSGACTCTALLTQLCLPPTKLLWRGANNVGLIQLLRLIALAVPCHLNAPDPQLAKPAQHKPLMCDEPSWASAFEAHSCLSRCSAPLHFIVGFSI